MKPAKSIGLYPVVLAVLLQVAPSVALAQTGSDSSRSNSNDAARVTQHVTKLLQDFLAAVPRGDKQVFDDFFADDVIYTRSAGVTVNKAEIIKNIGVRAANEPAATFEADGITVHPYRDMAVVNFRLVMHNENNGKSETAYYRNTGTFLKRNGKWQVVAWQSTKVPDNVEVKKQ
ncbi:MAG TPA: nuclear transport factor 2 family protein [Candidatus Solibacter sp.]|jgi:ketosteroid isomerase-like protein|nr:nuclear transport factor 2 family protein [Candidatus Solibacter sp.]